jgi:hypothetical protein
MPYAKQTEAAKSVFDRNRRREAEINDGLKQARQPPKHAPLATVAPATW